MNKRLIIILLLGFSSGIPLALLTTTLQAWFADTGASVMAVGMLSLLSLPYAYRIFWGPLLDRYALLPIGKRRSWILVMQILLCLGFNVIAWFSPMHSPRIMATIALALAFFSATQDAAIDAHRIEYLPEADHGLGASLAVIGYRLALFMTGGVTLILAQHYGWSFAYRFAGCLMLLGIIAVFLSREPETPPVLTSSLISHWIEPLRELFSRPHVISLLCFIFFYKLGEAFTTNTSGIMMPFLIQELKFPLETIAYVNKILGISTILLGSILAGFILRRCSLYRTLFCFGVFQAMTNLIFVALAMVGQNLNLLVLAVASDNFAAGMGGTALVAFLMHIVDRRFTTTQFSLFVILATLPRILSGPMAAFLQAQWGWIGVYQCAFGLALIFIPFLWIIRPMTIVRNEQLQIS